MEDLLGRDESPGLAARQLEEEAAEQDVESGGHAPPRTPSNQSTSWPDTGRWKTYQGEVNHLDWWRANSKKRQPNKTWSLEDMPLGTPSHRAQNGVQTK
ncbi:hypothetical protein SDJN03_07044, partial [Cucurbita argyrosperma subsp. sororia]